MPRRSPLTSVTAGALHRDVGPGAHRDADVGLGERRGVVDAVAGHRHDAALGLEPLDHFALLLGQHLGPDVVDPELPRHGLGGRPVVAGEHDDPQALLVKRFIAAGGRFLDRVGDAEQARRPAVDGDEHHRLALAAELLGPSLELAGIDARARRASFRLPIATVRPVDRARRRPGPVSDWNAPTSEQRRVPAPWPRRRSAAASGCSLARSRLAARRSSSDSSWPWRRRRRRRARLALGQRAGLVDHQRVDLLQRLERLGVLDQHAGRAPRGPCRP